MEPTFSAQVEGTVITIVLLRPRFDAAAAARFKAQLTETWPAGLTAAAVDMSVVDFIDSSGVGALLGLYRRFPDGAMVTLRALQPQVLSVIELLRLHRIFQIQE